MSFSKTICKKVLIFLLKMTLAALCGGLAGSCTYESTTTIENINKAVSSVDTLVINPNLSDYVSF